MRGDLWIGGGRFGGVGRLAGYGGGRGNVSLVGAVEAAGALMTMELR